MSGRKKCEKNRGAFITLTVYAYFDAFLNRSPEAQSSSSSILSPFHFLRNPGNYLIIKNPGTVQLFQDLLLLQ